MKILSLSTIAIAIATLTTSVFAANASAMDSAQQKQIEQVVHSYIVKNPEILVESMQVLQKRQMDQARLAMQKTQETAPQYADDLFRAANDPVAGNPKGAVTLVEFFDYQCPHCVDVSPVIDNLIKANTNLRVVFKEFPIRGPLSETATRVGLAARIQGKYVEFHKGLMQAAQQPLTEAVIYQVAQNAGLDLNKIKTDMKSPMVEQQMKDTYKLAQSLKLMGTPAFFVAASNVTKTAAPTAIVFIPGQVSQEQLQEVIGKVGQ